MSGSALFVERHVAEAVDRAAACLGHDAFIEAAGDEPDDRVRNGSDRRIENDAQHAISVWLLTRIGSHTMCGMSIDPLDRGMGFPSAAACDAGERFAALPEVEQRAWLEAHYADLRAGTLTLVDLP